MKKVTIIGLGGAGINFLNSLKRRVRQFRFKITSTRR